MTFNEFIYFYPEKPTLMTVDQKLFDLLSISTAWVAEPKYNGCRLELHLMDGKPEFWDRHGKKLVYDPSPEVLEAIANELPQKGYYVFDGELRHKKVIGVSHKVMLYDIHIEDGELLIGTTFEERRDILESMLTIGAEPLGVPVQYKNDFLNVFNTLVAEDEELEGLVLKNLSGELNLGRTRGQNSLWMKKVRKKTGRHHF